MCTVFSTGPDSIKMVKQFETFKNLTVQIVKRNRSSQLKVKNFKKKRITQRDSHRLWCDDLTI